MPKITIDVPAWLHADMAKLFSEGTLCRTEGLQGDCKMNVDYLIAQVFHPSNTISGRRELALRQIGKTNHGVPHLEFIECDPANLAPNKTLYLEA